MNIAWPVLSSVARLVQQHFPTLSHKRHNFREKGTEHKIRVLIFSTTSETFITPRSIQRGIVINVHWSSCKVPIYFVRFE
jgi:hypothetical protein